MTADEYAAFRGKGRDIDYCGERLANQKLNDDRAATRKDLRPSGGGRDLIDLVIDAIAVSDRPSELLAAHQETVRKIMSKPHNHRRRRLTGLSTCERRHQRAIRLVHALAFDDVTQADHCRQHKVDKADASRMLAHLYEKEPGLREGIDAISACGTAISWQNRQQNKTLLRIVRERGEVRLDYGLNEQIVSAEPYPCQASAPGMARDNLYGGLRYLHLIPDEPYKPDEWWVCAFVCSLFEPPKDNIIIRTPAPYRVRRPLSREVKLKDGSKKTWAVARAVPIEAWAYPAYRSEATDWPDEDRRFLDRALARFMVFSKTPNDALTVYKKVKRKLLGLLTPSRGCPRASVVKGRVECRRIERWPQPMCQPAHSGWALISVRRAIGSRRKAIWSPRSVRKPHGILQAFTRRTWIPWPVKETETLLVKQTEAGMPLYFVRNVTSSTTETI